MEENKFFKYVWRINGLMILLGAAAVALILLLEMFKSTHIPEPVIVENLADDPENKEHWVIGYPLDLKGADYLLLPLVSENREADVHKGTAFSSDMASYGKRVSDPTKNILFLNKESNESYWLLKGTQQLILDISPFPHSYSKDEKPLVIFYDVVVRDSNGDGKLSYADKPSLYMSDTAGQSYQPVLEAYDKVISRQLVGENRAILVYQSEGKAFSRIMQLSPFKVLNEAELPKVQL